jgi:fructokinase
VFDVNLRQSLYTPTTVRQSLGLADVVKLNEDEARVVPALLEWSTEDAKDLARRLLAEYPVKVVCVTRGAAGCTLIDADEELDISGRPSSAVDTVGAGDAFTAAFVLGKLSDLELARCGEFANAYAAVVAGKEGAMPDVSEQVDAMLAEYLSGTAP